MSLSSCKGGILFVRCTFHGIPDRIKSYCTVLQQATAANGACCKQGAAASRSGAGLCGGLQQQGLHLLQVPPARPLGPGLPGRAC